MRKQEVLQRLRDCGVVAVVRGDNEEQAMKIIDSCIKAGIVGIEVTFTVPGALGLIEKVAKKYSPKKCWGAPALCSTQRRRAPLYSRVRITWSAPA
jgi:2-dehydro-3-deoxyphosphogluconate aldolase/(4S)-4-hydroxy-2-oxoglutarate aldolase